MGPMQKVLDGVSHLKSFLWRNGEKLARRGLKHAGICSGQWYDFPVGSEQYDEAAQLKSEIMDLLDPDNLTESW